MIIQRSSSESNRRRWNLDHPLSLSLSRPVVDQRELIMHELDFRAFRRPRFRQWSDARHKTIQESLPQPCVFSLRLEFYLNTRDPVELAGISTRSFCREPRCPFVPRPPLSLDASALSAAFPLVFSSLRANIVRDGRTIFEIIRHVLREACITREGSSSWSL